MGQELRSFYSYWPTPGLCTRLLAGGPSAGWVLAGLFLNHSFSRMESWVLLEPVNPEREQDENTKPFVNWSQQSHTISSVMFFCSLEGMYYIQPSLNVRVFCFFFLTNYWIKKNYLFIWLPWILVASWSILCCSVQTQVVVPGSEVSAPTCSVVCGILLPSQGLNSTHLHDKADSFFFFFIF